MQHFYSKKWVQAARDERMPPDCPSDQEAELAAVNGEILDSADSVGFRELHSRESGQTAIAIKVAFFAGRLHTMRMKLRLKEAKVLRFEVHGLATRTHKAVALIDRRGKVIGAAEEIEDLAVIPAQDGSLDVQLSFVPFRSMVEWFYIFAEADECGLIASGRQLFALGDVQISVQSRMPAFRSCSHQPARKFGDVLFAIQSFSIYRNYIYLHLELHKPGTRLSSLALTSPFPLEFTQWWTWEPVPKPATISAAPGLVVLVPHLPQLPISSPALMDEMGPGYANKGHVISGLFRDYMDFRRMSLSDTDRSRELILHAGFEDGSHVSLDLLGSISSIPNDEWLKLLSYHLSSINPESSDERIFLEAGARGEASRQMRDFLGSGWKYVGFDNAADKNVDLIADAHSFSEQIEHSSISVVYSSEVMEHLLMPARFVLEANKVLRKRGLFIARAPMTWPLHAEPWDYWRFSAHSWHGLLNKHTGFEILDTCEFGEASIVPALPNWSGITRMQFDPAPMLTGVVARKIADTDVTWLGWSSGLAGGCYDRP